MIRFKCPGCKKTFKAADEHAGMKTRCKNCNHRFRVPKPEAVETPRQPHRNPPWSKWLAESQQRFGQAPRKFDEETKKYISMDMGWIASVLFFMPMCKLLKNSRQRKIFQDGQVVWAHIIQVNNVLWSPSTIAGPENPEDDDAPGELVFAVDPSGRVTPDYLQGVAARLAALRGTEPANRELKKIGNYLEAETVRAFGWKVPQALSPKVPCFISTTIFLRKHLPDGYLRHSHFPVIVTSTEPHFAMPLPERYWASDFLDWWKQTDGR